MKDWEETNYSVNNPQRINFLRHTYRACRPAYGHLFSKPWLGEVLLPSGEDTILEQEKTSIRFEGKTLSCRSGTSLAVALFECGIRTLSHSPKYGHPRGLTCARGQCTACLMRVDGEPNVRTCQIPIREGMAVQRQDTGAFYGPVLQKTISWGHNFFPVGFYYKWFTRPPFVSRMFLQGIRPLTGVGRLPDLAPQPSHKAEDLGEFETVIVGAGPSGIQAAVASQGPAVIFDDNPELGGQRAPALRRIGVEDPALLDYFPGLAMANERLQTSLHGLKARTNVVFHGGCQVIAGYQPHGLLLRSGDQLKTLSCQNLVWAAGALDTLGIFPGNDTPGLIGPRALYRILTRDDLNIAGAQVLIVGSGLDFWLSACLVAVCGAHPNLVFTGNQNGTEVAAAVARKWPLHTGLDLSQLKPSSDNRLLASFTPHSDQARTRSTHLDLGADLAVVCNQGKPVYDIPHQLGRELALYPERGGFLPTGAGNVPLRGVLPGGLSLEFRGEAAGMAPGTDTGNLAEVKNP